MDIARAVHRFNQSSDALQLPTRIGLHSGHMAIGNVGAIDHYEYRAAGDIVNTVGRIERLNKQLGTQILVSAEVLHRLDGFLTRELGEFLFSGKSKPVVLYELLCRLEESEEKQRELCEFFAEGLRAYRNQAWEEASQRFCNCTQLAQEDKPSLYYLNMCETYGKNPPGEEWNGLVYIDKK